MVRISKYLILLLNRNLWNASELVALISKYLILLLNLEKDLDLQYRPVISKYLILLLNLASTVPFFGVAEFQNILYYY